MQSQVWWYVGGFFAALIWKYLSWVYVGVIRQKKAFGACSREWLEMKTIDSRVSWLATIALVWVIGTFYIKQIGLSWLFGGVLQGIPVCDPMAFLLGVLAEYTAPALLKFIASKIPFFKTPED